MASQTDRQTDMIDMPILCDSTVGLVSGLSAGYGDLNFLNVHDGVTDRQTDRHDWHASTVWQYIISLVSGLSAGYGDLNFLNVHDGGDELLSAVQLRARPKFHVFGHIHEGTQVDISNTLSHNLYSVS